MWAALPNDLCAHLLNHLPWRDFVRARRVCRAWRRASESPVATVSWTRRFGNNYLVSMGILARNDKAVLESSIQRERANITFAMQHHIDYYSSRPSFAISLCEHRLRYINIYLQWLEEKTKANTLSL
jgi:hypothetical protein